MPQKGALYKMTNKLSESKLWKAITAVASSIMTSLLYDLLSRTSYVMQKDGARYILTPDDSTAKNTILSIVIIVLLFFFLWGIFTATIQIGVKISRQLRFKEIEHISGKDLVKALNTAKANTLLLKKGFYDEQSNILNINFVVLHLTELAIIVSSLHAMFVPHNRQRKANIKDYFRQPNRSTIIGITNGVSKYEFMALIELLYKMTNDISSCSLQDELMTKDCSEMLAMLNELKEIANSVK